MTSAHKKQKPPLSKGNPTDADISRALRDSEKERFDPKTWQGASPKERGGRPTFLPKSERKKETVMDKFNRQHAASSTLSVTHPSMSLHRDDRFSSGPSTYFDKMGKLIDKLDESDDGAYDFPEPKSKGKLVDQVP